MLSTLSQASALNPGSDLWVVTDIEASKWTAKLDWYLNFQIIKASRHEPAKISSFLQQVVDSTGAKVPQIETKKEAPLLIQSQSLLPNKWVLVVAYHDNFPAWIKEIHQIWQQLQSPSIRIFLPTGQSASSLTEKTLSEFNSKDLTVVLDLSH